MNSKKQVSPKTEKAGRAKRPEAEAEPAEHELKQQTEAKAEREKKATKSRKKNKKEAQIVIRLERDIRDRFVAACQELDTSASREVRRFMKQFLRRYDNGELDD